MDILGKITADFKSKLGRSVEVPEWGGTVIYYNPLTALERVQINKGVSEGDETVLFINLLITKALDGDGKQMFEDNAQTRAILEGGADFKVVTRIVTEMGADGPDLDTSKNA